jgi:hypothetical protein
VVGKLYNYKYGEKVLKIDDEIYIREKVNPQL